MKPWPLPLLLTSLALAGGTEAPALPRLSLDARTVGRSAEVQTVPAVIYPDDAPYFQMFPAHVRAVLNAPGQRWKAQYDADVPPASVAVYPVSGWLSLFKTAAVTKEIRRQIDTVRALNTGTLRVRDIQGALPFLPLRNAFQAVAGSVRTVETPILQGIRYLTVYSQESSVRFPREAVFYTFQGLSRDAQFYVTVQVPYAPASLPTQAEQDRTKNYLVAPYPAQSSGPAQEAFRRASDAYLTDLRRKLNAEEGKAGLRALDALVRSIRLR